MHFSRARSMRLVASGVVVLSLGASAAVASAGSATAAGGSSVDGAVRSGKAAAARPVNGAAALERIGDRLPEVARANGFGTAELADELRRDSTLHVDDSLELLYVDAPAPGEQVDPAPVDQTSAAPPVTDRVFQLESLPGADHTILLDFDGETSSGTSWNGGATIESPPYDIDGAPDSWTSTELARIEATWKAVSEDFAPFDVNVTTRDPGAAALTRSGSGDTTWGTRVLFTRNVAAVCTGCGGVAYIGSFDDPTDEPVFVFNTGLTGMIEAASHEVGHAMLLAHDGKGTDTYYGGHGSGETGWGPIMGAGYNRNVTQWSRGEYVDATNTGSQANYNRGDDDLAILSSLTNGNGFGYRVDDHGDTPGSATPVSSGSHSGLISTTNDVDAFTISTGGGLRVTASPARANPNLDVCLKVLAGGVEIASASPSTLAATIDLPTTAAGTYVVTVDGCGFGDPFASTPTGWTQYGSLGRYTLDVTATDRPTDTEAPATPVGLAASMDGAGVVTLVWTANTEADLAGYRVMRSTTGATPVEIGSAATAEFVDGTTAPGARYGYSVVAVDLSGLRSAASSEVVVTTPALPVTPDVATGDLAVTGSVIGTHSDTWTSDGVTQTVVETQSGGRPSSRHDSATHIWSIPVTAGNHLLQIEADVSIGGDADSGFELAWSRSQNGPWTSLDLLGDGVRAATYDLGAPSGTVYVRVMDDDRSVGNNVNGSIRVDLLRLNGGRPPTTLPGSVSDPSPADGATGVATDVDLRWAPANGARSYDVTVSSGGVEVASTTTTSTAWTVPGLEPDTTYVWSVTATNGLGSTPGPQWSFTTAGASSQVTVTSLTTSEVGVGRGSSAGSAVVAVADEFGAPVAGAVVQVTFSGDLSGSVSGTTDSSGSVTLISTTSAKKATWSVCVSSVRAAGLTTTPSTFSC